MADEPLKIPLTPHGVRELTVATLVLGLLTAAALWWIWPLAVIPLGLLVFVYSFFRDPERSPPADPEVLVSPADGTVTDVLEIDNPPLIEEPCLRIGIFLSVFNVHVNRCPLNATLKAQHYRPGEFLDARHPDATERNEAQDILLEAKYPVLVRQISGLIARRIVFPFSDGTRFERGQRMGMIKFGSRTELYLPLRGKPESLVKAGDKVRGTATAIARFSPESTLS